jgi:RNA polymerase sigma factor (sigma-70 family)
MVCQCSGSASIGLVLLAVAGVTRLDEPFPQVHDFKEEWNGADVTHPSEPGHLSHQEDELLVIRCQLGERPAFDELVERWHGPVWKYVRRVAGGDDAAWDIAQDVWLRVLRGIGRLRDGTRLRSWLFGIARRALMDRLRHQYATPVDADVDLSALPADVCSDESEAELAAMERELARLPVIEREVLTLFYLRELSLTEVADVLGVPIGTVKSRLFRARRQLRRGLDSEGESA